MLNEKPETEEDVKPAQSGGGKAAAAPAARTVGSAGETAPEGKTAAPAAEEAGDSKEAELVEMFIAMRQDARKNKNYALADELRNKLNEIGIVLQDTPQGVKWSKQ